MPEFAPQAAYWQSQSRAISERQFLARHALIAKECGNPDYAFVPGHGERRTSAVFRHTAPRNNSGRQEIQMRYPLSSGVNYRAMRQDDWFEIGQQALIVCLRECRKEIVTR
jgi:hypothetical protein